MTDQIVKRRIKLQAFVSTLIIFWLLCFAGWNDAIAADKKVFVLCYHSFLGNKPFPSDIPMEEFRSQMNFLKGKGFHFVSYSDLLKGTLTGTQNILIVIDDGNHSVLQAYQEVLKPLGIKPTLAIYPNIIGKKSYALTWDQLKGLVHEGCDIAAHGYYHELMNQKFYDSNKTEFIHEIVGSKEALQKMLGVKISAFVYPNGVRCDMTKKILKESGYSNAFTIQWGAVLSPLNLNRDLLELPRYMVLKGNWNMISSSIIKASSQ
jgi:peptidoglycan/xylan/chitin deacetylase (PgdA/CDA1 family)